MIQLISLFTLLFTLQSFADTPTKLILNWKPEPEFGGFYEAQASGFFKEHGLDVTIQPGAAGTPVVQMVAAGQADFGICNGDHVVLSQDKGSDIVALFAVYQDDPQGIMTHEARKFKSLADVFHADGVLAAQQGAPFMLYLKKKYAPIKTQIVPYTGGITQFLIDQTYSQQCYFTSEPLQAEKKGYKTKTFLIAESGYNPYNTVLVARRELIEKNPLMVTNFRNAVKKGWEKYLKNPDATNALMAKLNPSMDEATFKAIAERQKSLIETKFSKKNGIGAMDPSRWKTMIDQLHDLKLIKAKFSAEKCFFNGK